jgi:F0F1-type ATP synthase assembly protein I
LAYSRTPAGDWDVKRAQHDLKVAATAHEHEIERRRLEHELEQQARDNDNRRQREMLLFYAALVTGVVLLGVGLVVGVVLDTSEAKAGWARSIVTAILGAFAGYLTGKSTK